MLPLAHLAYLSLGSNIGDREANLREAIPRLETLGSLRSLSSIYETEPVEVTDQPWFLNCVVVVETTLTVEEMMARLLQIEKAMGRQRTRKKGPRRIDIDILLFDESILDSAEVTIPHPAMHERRFVMEPLAEIAPEARHPALGKTAAELLEALPAGQIVRRVQKSPRIHTDLHR